MLAAEQYTAHLVGLFLLASAMTADVPVHPAMWLGCFMLIAVPVLAEKKPAPPP